MTKNHYFPASESQVLLGQSGLAVNNQLNPGDKLISENNEYNMKMQRDGNLVIYKQNPEDGVNQHAVWATGTKMLKLFLD